MARSALRQVWVSAALLMLSGAVFAQRASDIVVEDQGLSPSGLSCQSGFSDIWGLIQIILTAGIVGSMVYAVMLRKMEDQAKIYEQRLSNVKAGHPDDVEHHEDYEEEEEDRKS